MWLFTMTLLLPVQFLALQLILVNVTHVLNKSLTGLSEVEEGEVDGHKIHLLSHTVGRISFGAEPKVLKVQNERIRSDSSQLFFRCYYYFVSAVFVVQCILVLSGAGIGCTIESVTIKWVIGSSKLKNNGETTKT